VKQLWVAVRTSPDVATVIGVASLLALLVKVAWFNFLPPVFPHAVEVGLVFEGLLIGNLSAYIFFIVTVQLPVVSDRTRLAKPVLYGAESVANGVWGFLQMLSNAQTPGIVKRETVTLETVTSLFARVNANDIAPMLDGLYGKDQPWPGALILHQKQCKAAIDDVWRFGRFLESDLIELISEIERSYEADPTYVTLLERGATWPDSMEGFAQGYYRSYELARSLDAYCARFRKEYT
jgi:hypothetical protein